MQTVSDERTSYSRSLAAADAASAASQCQEATLALGPTAELTAALGLKWPPPPVTQNSSYASLGGSLKSPPPLVSPSHLKKWRVAPIPLRHILQHVGNFLGRSGRGAGIQYAFLGARFGPLHRPTELRDALQRSCSCPQGLPQAVGGEAGTVSYIASEVSPSISCFPDRLSGAVDDKYVVNVLAVGGAADCGHGDLSPSIASESAVPLPVLAGNELVSGASSGSETALQAIFVDEDTHSGGCGSVYPVDATLVGIARIAGVLSCVLQV
jgi:hypothetical protein